MIWVWGIVTAATLILEFITAGLISVWFAAGSFITLLATLIFPKLPILWQAVIFVVSSIGLLLATRPLFKKFTKQDVKMNSDALVGKRFKIGKQIEGNKIYHKIADVEWRVVEDSEEELKQGDFVEIISIKGNKLVVNKVKEDKKGE